MKNSQGKNLFEDRSGAISFTRDALSLAVAKEMAKGEPGKEAVYLDLKGVPKDELSMKFPSDKGLLQVYPAAHFFMGGVWVKENLDTSILGLYVAGEAMGGVHGASRLGGNALAEAFVFGSIIGSQAALFAKGIGGKTSLRVDLANQAVKEFLERMPRGKGEELPAWQEELRSTLEESAWVMRDKRKLERGLGRIYQLGRTFCFPHENPEKIWLALSLHHQLTVTEMILKSALMREESRGAHFREDFPLENDRDWRVNILLEKRESEPMRLWREPVGH